MRVPLPGRLATPSFGWKGTVGHRSKVLFPTSRQFSQSANRHADEPPNPQETPTQQSQPATKRQPQNRFLLDSLYGISPKSSQTPSNAMANLSQSLVFQALGKSSAHAASPSSIDGSSADAAAVVKEYEPFHFHIYAHKHNTHVTCTQPNRNTIISMSCGNIGFRKSKRGSFDAAYSLTKYVLERLVHTGWPPKINRLEIVTRGFGKGREAAVKVLMSPEGKILRDKIVRVSDSTRIKYAGTRSKRKRRL
jgi:small subunit ribosomal protein S11